MVMRLILGLLLTLTLLSGCGDDAAPADDRAVDPSASESRTPSQPPATGPVDFELVGIVSASAVGGAVANQGVDLSDDAALAEFEAQFESGRMGDLLETEIAGASVSEGQVLVGAVVAIGCLPPTDVTVRRTDAGLVVNAVETKPEKQVECFAPVTSVAIVAVDADQV